MTNRITAKTTSSTPHPNQLALLPVNSPTELRWWAPVWRGLVVDPQAKHRRAMGNALWVYMYLLLHANRVTGVLRRKLSTISKDMGSSPRVIQYGIGNLRRGGYIITRNSGRCLEITITKWQTLKRNSRRT